MTAIMLDGNLYASQIKAEVAEEVQQLAASGLRPGLAAVLVGHDPASESYVRSKVLTCGRMGIFSELITPPETSTTEELRAHYTDEQIVEITLVVGISNLTNRFNNGLGILPEA